ncbi:MAG: phosphoribosylanthranilate isomerase [Terrimicrobiaceae bacterium]
MFFEPQQGRTTLSKICGITNKQDALNALDSGAEAIGINAYPASRRYANPSICAHWLNGLAGKISRVVVVVNPSEAEVDALHGLGVFDAIQFHGEETPDFCARSRFPHWIKAVRVQSPSDLELALQFDSPYLLLDGWSPGQYGGTGTRVDWDLARDFVAAHPDRRVILAGGLNPLNVHTAIRIVRPYAVDVAGGVEASPGLKEDYLVREFVKASSQGY